MSIDVLINLSVLQNVSDFEVALEGLEENHCSIAVFTSDQSLEFYVVAERTLLGCSNRVVGLLMGLIGAFFYF